MWSCGEKGHPGACGENFSPTTVAQWRSKRTHTIRLFPKEPLIWIDLALTLASKNQVLSLHHVKVQSAQTGVVWYWEPRTEGDSVVHPRRS